MSVLSIKKCLYFIHWMRFIGNVTQLTLIQTVYVMGLVKVQIFNPYNKCSLRPLSAVCGLRSTEPFTYISYQSFASREDEICIIIHITKKCNTQKVFHVYFDIDLHVDFPLSYVNNWKTISDAEINCLNRKKKPRFSHNL